MSCKYFKKLHHSTKCNAPKKDTNTDGVHGIQYMLTFVSYHWLLSTSSLKERLTSYSSNQCLANADATACAVSTTEETREDVRGTKHEVQFREAETKLPLKGLPESQCAVVPRPPYSSTGRICSQNSAVIRERQIGIAKNLKDNWPCWLFREVFGQTQSSDAEFEQFMGKVQKGKPQRPTTVNSPLKSEFGHKRLRKLV
ncbi:hypothetical protein CHS0354_025840 [Potamilus streckersoni]|uniref:Uncharacterized protein n=1 Tax=Potamilus streckersoni TaxID=2493646 RepID=A0AAE0SCA0_9BIVA|nr:hypothetical protein CHS0354_025840 [Potamilus streckersoni]